MFTQIFFKDFPKIGSIIYKIAVKRKNRTDKTYKEAVKFCKK